MVLASPSVTIFFASHRPRMLSLKKMGREQEGDKGWNWVGRVLKQANKKEKERKRKKETSMHSIELNLYFEQDMKFV